MGNGHIYIYILPFLKPKKKVHVEHAGCCIFYKNVLLSYIGIDTNNACTNLDFAYF